MFSNHLINGMSVANYFHLKAQLWHLRGIVENASSVQENAVVKGWPIFTGSSIFQVLFCGIYVVNNISKVHVTTCACQQMAPPRVVLDPDTDWGKYFDLLEVLIGFTLQLRQ